MRRSDRALDRHFGDVDDEPATTPLVQLVAEGEGTVIRIELPDFLMPLRSQHPRCLIGAGGGAGGEDELVVAEHPTGRQLPWGTSGSTRSIAAMIISTPSGR